MEAGPQAAMDEALAEEDPPAAKRPRKELPEPTPELPLEMQIKLLEWIEGPHAGVEPVRAVRLAEISKVYLRAYADWVEGRRSKMAKAPDRISIALVRLFISPRFKLISAMPVTARNAILEAYGPCIRSGRRLLVFYRDVRNAKWTVALTQYVSGDGEARRVVAIKIDDSAPMNMLAFGDTTFEFPANAIEPVTVAGDASEVLLYGKAAPTFMEYPESVMRSSESFLVLFFVRPDTAYDAPPTAAMLGWRDKIAVLRVEENSFAGSIESTVTVAYEVAIDDERSIVVSPSPEAWGATFADLVDAAYGLARDGSEETVDTSSYVRMTANWHTGESVDFYDSRRGEGSKAYAFPRDAMSIAALADEFARRGEPRLRRILAHPEWGYSGDLYIPHPPSTWGSSGLMIMPAPWYFFFRDRSPSQIRLSRGLFRYHRDQVLIFALDDPFLLAHQPHELIYLPDDLAPSELAQLTMLQREDIAERATARQTQDVVPL